MWKEISYKYNEYFLHIYSYWESGNNVERGILQVSWAFFMYINSLGNKEFGIGFICNKFTLPQHVAGAHA